MKNFRPDKNLKRRRQWKDYAKKRNILRDWRIRQVNRQKVGLPVERPPVMFPDRKKFTEKKTKK
jgi:hypothetical protein